MRSMSSPNPERSPSACSSSSRSQGKDCQTRSVSSPRSCSREKTSKAPSQPSLSCTAVTPRAAAMRRPLAHRLDHLGHRRAHVAVAKAPGGGLAQHARSARRARRARPRRRACPAGRRRGPGPRRSATASGSPWRTARRASRRPPGRAPRGWAPRSSRRRASRRLAASRRAEPRAGPGPRGRAPRPASARPRGGPDAGRATRWGSARGRRPARGPRRRRAGRSAARRGPARARPSRRGSPAWSPAGIPGSRVWMVPPWRSTDASSARGGAGPSACRPCARRCARAARSRRGPGPRRGPRSRAGSRPGAPARRSRTRAVRRSRGAARRRPRAGCRVCARSEASSGGVSSSASRTAATMSRTGPSSALRSSSLVTATSRGRPEAGSRPRTSQLASVRSGCTLPISRLTCSEVVSPIASPWLARIQAATVSSKS